MKPHAAQRKCLGTVEKHKGLVAVLLTVAGGLCAAVCLLLLLGHATTTVTAHLRSRNFAATSCTVNVSELFLEQREFGTIDHARGVSNGLNHRTLGLSPQKKAFTPNPPCKTFIWFLTRIFVAPHQNITLLNWRMECNCKGVCSSSYPCLLVRVEYNLPGTGNEGPSSSSGRNVTTTLFHTDSILNDEVCGSALFLPVPVSFHWWSVTNADEPATWSLFHQKNIFQCSYKPGPPCSESKEENNLDVEHFRDTLKEPGHKVLSCLYNPQEPAEVILVRSSTTGKVSWYCLFLALPTNCVRVKLASGENVASESAWSRYLILETKQNTFYLQTDHLCLAAQILFFSCCQW